MNRPPTLAVPGDAVEKNSGRSSLQYELDDGTTPQPGTYWFRRDPPSRDMMVQVRETNG